MGAPSQQPAEARARAARRADPPARRRRISTCLRARPSIRFLDLTDRVALSRQFGRDRSEADLGRIALRTGRHKLVLSRIDVRPEDPVVELYDLAMDPGERNNLASQSPELVSRLRKDLAGQADRLDAAGRADFRVADEVTPVLRERLRALGYLD